jgi:MinD-like ATPase involved in chromosome partitioning or flagellar assembly
MAKIISIHSFRRGTGKSILSANLGVLLALAGYRTGLIDIDVASPSLQLLFGLGEADMKHTVSEYLLGLCSIGETVYDATRGLNLPGEGRLFLIPSSLKPGQIARVMRQDYDIELLNDAFQRLIHDLHLDVLVVDTRAGINDDALLTFAISYSLAVIIRPDKRDYQGTGIILGVARQLNVPRVSLVINQVPPRYDPDIVREKAEQTFGCDVVAALPHSSRLMALGSAGIFCLRYPDDSLTLQLWQLMTHLADTDANPLFDWARAR